LYLSEISNREEELKNTLTASKSKVRDLEISLWEVEAGGQELKRAMKEATDSEYAISQKLLMRQELVEALKPNLKWF
jgi:predicted  nucleic acid-binding Zn-ribbon protein